MKGKTRRKMMAIEMSKELRSKINKTKPKKSGSAEHKLFEQLDKGEE